MIKSLLVSTLPPTPTVLWLALRIVTLMCGLKRMVSGSLRWFCYASTELPLLSVGLLTKINSLWQVVLEPSQCATLMKITTGGAVSTSRNLSAAPSSLSTGTLTASCSPRAQLTWRLVCSLPLSRVSTRSLLLLSGVTNSLSTLCVVNSRAAVVVGSTALPFLLLEMFWLLLASDTCGFPSLDLGTYTLSFCAGHDSSINIAYPSADGNPTVITVATPSLPYLSLIWANDKQIVAAGHDCAPVLFETSNNQDWHYTGSLDENKKKISAVTSVLSRFKTMDSRGQSDSDTDLNTVHQNTIL